MAISTTTRSICNKVANDYPGLSTPIRQAKGLIRSKAFEFEDQLRNTIFSSTSALDTALQQFEDDLEDILPGDTAQDVQDIKDIIDNCNYLSALNSVSAVAGTALGIYHGIANIIDDISNSTPEFTAGGFADQINNILKGIQFPFGDDISKLFSNADQLIQCLESFCGGEYPLQVSEFSSDLNGLYTDMNIVSDPNNENYTNFDFNKIYSNVNMNAQQIENMTKTIDKIDGGNNRAKEAIDSSIEAVKDSIRLQGIGGF